MTVPQPHRRRASRSRALASTGSYRGRRGGSSRCSALSTSSTPPLRRISTGGADEAIAKARHLLRLEHLAGLTPERWQPRRTSRDPQLEHPRARSLTSTPSPKTFPRYERTPTGTTRRVGVSLARKHAGPVTRRGSPTTRVSQGSRCWARAGSARFAVPASDQRIDPPLEPAALAED